MKRGKISHSKAVGTVFEGVAETVLKEKGYTVLERNYTFGKYETDLIVKKETEIAFVEVKSRCSDAVLPPESAVGKEKMKHILFCAAGYIKFLSEKGIDPRKFSYSFDVIGIVYNCAYDLESVRCFKNYYEVDKDELLRFAL